MSYLILSGMERRHGYFFFIQLIIWMGAEVTQGGEKSSDDLTERHSKFLCWLYFVLCFYVLCAGEEGIALTV